MGNFEDRTLCMVKGADCMLETNLTAEELICDESFQRYCTGQNTADTHHWESWIKNNPQHANVVHEAIKVISILNGKQGNVQEQLHHLQDSIKRFDHLKLALGKEIKKGPPKKILRYITAAAASLLLLAGAAYFIFYSPKTKQTGITVAAGKNASIISSGNEPRKTIVLSDGSVVTLRNNSSIRLADNFSGNNRELELSGEAFFDVTHNASMPFIVRTEEANIEVLGTVFNVSAYPGSAQTETALFRGKVSVTTKDHPGQKVILTPSKKIIISKSSQLGNNKPASSLRVFSLTADPVSHKAKEIAWVRNRLKIEDESLNTIAQKLQNWYGINIIFKDEEVKTYRYSGTFESETVLKALEALQLSYPFNFQVEKERIIIGR